MQDMSAVKWYHYGYRAAAAAGLIVAAPLLGILYIAVKMDSAGPFIFPQKRTGCRRKPFTIFKIRSMYVGAEAQQKKLSRLNEADGPVFKISNDPRFTRVGKWLSRSGLDELPQLWNILRGEMSFVGPRPLPISEAKCVPKAYAARFSVLPGITSPWVINGNHNLSFPTWMELDLAYIKEQSLLKDIFIMSQTVFMVIRNSL
jgi:lipopolysaccharide/colanic/teichoic acid biosynthesis glycosyltransferase